jgi:poly-beta-hydroxybutyrate-responsive repressor
MEKFIQPCMLLLLYERPAHGYELMERLAQLGFVGHIDPGAVYRNLRKMEEDGLVKSEWESGESGPAKRRYVLTPEGEEAIHGWAVHVRYQMERLKAFLDKYEEFFKDGGNKKTD